MIRLLLDCTSLWGLRLLIGVLNCIPFTLRVRFVSNLLRMGTYFVPSFRRVSFRNLKLVYPEQNDRFLNEIYVRSFDNLARIIVDFARLHTLDTEWVQKHVECDFLPRFKELKQNSSSGVLIATGHLGSFELMAHSIAVLGYPISFVVRNSKLPRLDAWWVATRQKNGNEVIDRSGAVKKVIANLLAGKDAALLFDQNVKRNHAVFVDWFGKPAATTMTIGLAAVRCRAPVVVCSMRYLGDDRYAIDAVECPCLDVYEDSTLTLDQKIAEITMRATREFEQMILRSPEGWFWMHRRWKTTPEGVQESFYR